MKQTLEQVAQEAALKEYPVCKIYKDDMSGGEEVDVNEFDRLTYEEGFIAGWKAKEKQDELTVEDIAEIDDLLFDLRDWFDGKEIYTEILKRFKEYKKKKK